MGERQHVSRRLLGSALLLALAWVLTACGETGTAASTPQPTTAQTAGLADVETTPGPSVAPGRRSTASESLSIPAVGDFVTLRSMTEAVLPEDALIEFLEFDQTGKQYLRLVIDPAAHKGFREMTTMPNAPYPGFGLLVFDDGGHSEMGEMGLQVTPYGGGNFQQLIRLYDRLSGKSVEVTGHDTIDGRQTFVVKTTVEVAEWCGTLDISAWVDPATGLVVREEYRTEVGGSMRAERRVIDATADLLNRMDIKSMESIVAGYRKVREESLSRAPYPVYGLPSGYRGLPLTAVVPGADWRMVRLDYGSPGPNEYISITTLDPSKREGYRQEFLAPLDRAWLDAEGGGGISTMRFGLGEVGIQIQAPEDIIRQVAEDLIVVGGHGQLRRQPPVARVAENAAALRPDPR